MKALLNFKVHSHAHKIQDVVMCLGDSGYLGCSIQTMLMIQIL